jgi:hypothetical protein
VGEAPVGTSAVMSTGFEMTDLEVVLRGVAAVRDPAAAE